MSLIPSADCAYDSLEETIRKTPCDAVRVATPIDLRRVLRIDQPSQRVRYELLEIGPPSLADILRGRLGAKK